MSARVRESVPPSSSRPTGTALPSYEQPAFPLTLEAQRALTIFTRNLHLQQRLEQKLKDAQAAVSESAAEINDRLRNRQQAVEKHRKRKRTNEEGEENSEPDNIERGLDALKDKVERMTSRMDESMRKLIDSQHNVQFIRDALNATCNDARNANTQASTQGRSQRRPRQTAENEGEDIEQGDEEYEDFTPTDPGDGTQDYPTPIETFRTKLDNAKIRHQSHSLTARYAQNNDYVDFRRVVHDARHGDDEVPLAHPNDWFTEGDAPAPGVTTRAGANAEDDSDDDIAVSRATISTKCPLTLQEFKQPLSSKKCPHSFESAAILEMISLSHQRINGTTGARGKMTGGERAVRCPVGGCDAMLAQSDLHSDPVLLRKIKRLQRAKELEEEDAYDNAPRGTMRNATYIDDEDDDDGADIDALLERQTQPVKAEPRGTASRRTPAGSAPANPEVMEVDSESDENDEMDETDEE
ncbi:zinc-finger of the MIZ type in Nse subunit-domain-containing protein [Acrodontium crateriforme]|uniref:Zinc-finger of the MIZ type in Nse subunit-domain-containing protein n=1 Tax=Acrodontium crateriforme TaxID=150365 RepID=A0AAQ3M958_9PEZI|nr:zinc-finger of the MIZ type in Nse subunit-domain-containing protein [Acrodontium crateriforme]